MNVKSFLFTTAFTLAVIISMTSCEYVGLGERVDLETDNMYSQEYVDGLSAEYQAKIDALNKAKETQSRASATEIETLESRATETKTQYIETIKEIITIIDPNSEKYEIDEASGTIIDKSNNETVELSKSISSAVKEDASILESVNEKLEEYENQVISLKEDIDSLNISNSDLAEIRDELSQKIETLETSSNLKDTVIASLEDELDDAVETVNSLITTINSNNSTIDELNESISSKNTAIVTLESDIKEKQSTIDDKNEEIETLKAEIEEKKAEIAKIEEDNKNASETASAEAAKKISELNETITSKQTEINSLNTQIDTLNDTIKSIETTISEQNKEIAEQRTQIEEKNTTIEEQTSRIAELEATIESQKAEIEELKSSSSDNKSWFAKKIEEYTKAVVSALNSEGDLINETCNSLISSLSGDGNDYSSYKSARDADSLKYLTNQISTYVSVLKSQLVSHTVSKDDHPVSSTNVEITNVTVIFDNTGTGYCQTFGCDNNQKRVKYIFDFDAVYNNSDGHRWGEGENRGCNIHMYVNGNDENPTISTAQPYRELEFIGYVQFKDYSGNIITPIDIQYIDK